MKKNKLVIGILVVVGFLLLASVITAATLWGQRGEMVAMENQIDAQYDANKSNYDKMWKTFKEMTQVTELQAEQFKDVYTDLISGRYEDSAPLFSAIQEANPSLGIEVYTTLQRQIAADRAVFDNNQKKILDIINQYNTFVEHEAIIVAMLTNREPMKGSDFIITSERTEKTFESGQDDEIDLTN